VTGLPPDPGGTAPTVAALAVSLNRLRHDLDDLTAQVAAVTSTQRQHAILLGGLADLRQQASDILSLLTGENSDAPPPWFWLTMPDHDRDEKLTELTEWVNTILRVQYPGYLANAIRPCWPAHPEARWELAWLYQLWLHAYLSDHPALPEAANWHDRWAPGVIRRLASVMHGCAHACQQLPAMTTSDRYHA
jgi:hypothetical protein